MAEEHKKSGSTGKKAVKTDNDVDMKDGEYNWTDEEVADEEDAENQSDSQNYSAEDEEANSSLTRLSEQYQRYSRSRLNHSHSDLEEDHEDEDEDDNEEDAMRSIHHAARHENDDDHDEGEEHSDLNEEEYAELGNHILGAFRSLSNRVNADENPAAENTNRDERSWPSGQSSNPFGNRVSLVENMARIFPEAVGMFGGLQGNGASGIRQLIRGLSRRDDSFLVLETLNELSERLLMMNGLLADRGLPSYDLAHGIVGVMNEPMFQEELELQLVACRCLYNFLEINADYVHSAVQAGAIEALQSKLLEVNYIDLAEQALQTLEVISKVSGAQVFRKNCLTSCLQYLDFFTIHAQRKAINIVANSVKYIRPSELYLVEEILPTLTRIVIEFTDTQELEKAWLAIARIIKNFKTSPNLEKIITTELLNKMMSVIASSDTTLSTNLKLVNTLAIAAQNSNLASNIIKSESLISSITLSLLKYKKVSSSGVTIETLMSVPKDLIISLLDLLVCLLPIEESPILTTPEGQQRDYSTIEKSYKLFANDVFPLLINIYQSTVVYDIRRRVMVCLVRIISSLDSLKDVSEISSITNLLASIVIQNKSAIRTEKRDSMPYFALLGALILTRSLIEKDPDAFVSEFEREGLLSDTLALLEVLRTDEYVSLEENEDHDVDEEQHSEFDDNEDGGEEEYDDDEDDEYIEDYEAAEQFFGISGTEERVFRALTVPKILKHLNKLASDIEQIYLSKKASGSSKLEHLRLLGEITGDLSNKPLIGSYTREDWINVWTNFRKALTQESYVISSFELISSGIIQVLSSLFNDSSHGFEGSVTRTTFLEVFHGEPFELLVKKLQEALTRSELFEIISCGLKTGENRAASLGKQLKIKLSVVEDEDDEYFEGMSNFVVLIQAVASFSNINSFLKRRVEAPLLFGHRRSHEGTRKDWYVEFLLDDEVIPSDTTIYGALYKRAQNKNAHFDTNKFWYEIHEIKFRKVEGIQPALEFDERYPEATEEEEQNSLQKDAATVDILDLLKLLHDFNSKASFINFKLTAKLNRQLEEPLIVASGILPPWSINITRKYPFLFPLETRIFFLQSTSFGYSRLIQLWNIKANQDQDNNNNNNESSSNGVPLGRPTRHKVRVSRSHLLQSAYKVLDKLGSNPSIIEVEFADEVGTGLGPTLEFYAGVSHSFSQKKLGIWRSDEIVTVNEAEYVISKNGLFPAPLDPSQSGYSNKVEHFRYLGKFVARALLDNRIVDIHFSKLFFELTALEVSDQGYKLNRITSFEKIKQIDEQLYESLKYIQSNPSTVGDLALTFTLPGYPSIELIENGSNISVAPDNVDEYIDKIIDYTIGKGIKEQIQTFIAGFAEVFPFFSMLIFSPDELVELLGRSEEDWSYETLLSSLHADHGYNLDSPTVQNLVTLMSRFDDQERRLFLQFLTGSPRLPIGGFKNLKPDFTVVLKHSEGDLKPDDYLPSVMTCANYLKLPNYSSVEVLESRLKQAINEGRGSFLLS